MNQSWQQFLTTQGARFAESSITDFGDSRSELQSTIGATVITALTHTRIIKVGGEDASLFLQGQLTNDIRNIDAEHHQLSAHCSPKGRMLFIARLFSRDDAYYLLLPDELTDAALKRLKMFVLMSKVTIEEVTDEYALIGIAGADAQAIATTMTTPADQNDGVAQAESGALLSLSDTRYEAMVFIDQAESIWNRLKAQATPVGKPCWDYLDIVAGIPNVTTATVEAFVPQMANMQMINGVSFKKGCYTGQEVVARMQHLGILKRHMYRCHYDADVAPKVGDAIDSPTSTSGQGAGKVVTVAPSPNGGYAMLAVIENTSVEAGDVSINGTVLAIEELPYSLEKEN